MTTCHYGSDDSDFCDNRISFVLIAVLFAPYSQLLIADTGSNFDQMLLFHLSLLCLLAQFTNFSNLVDVLYALTHQKLIQFGHLLCVDLQNLRSSFRDSIRKERNQKLILIRKDVRPGMPRP